VKVPSLTNPMSPRFTFECGFHCNKGEEKKREREREREIGWMSDRGRSPSLPPNIGFTYKRVTRTSAIKRFNINLTELLHVEIEEEEGRWMEVKECGARRERV